MPGVGRYSCKSCLYVASNRRMLARHSVLVHLEKAFRCPLCPFVTKYAANWYRHKRDLHGLTKCTTCETCGFFANSTPELAQHREEEHPELLQLDKFEDKYAKEKIRLTEGCESRSQESAARRNESDFLLDIYDIDQEIDIKFPPEVSDEVNDDRDKYTPQLNGNFFADLEGAESGIVLKEGTPESAAGSDMNSSPDNLRPLRIRRSYNCDQCGLLTNNPREYLYHLRSVHGEKIAVHECKYCIYASKHIQKLQRHCNLVHRQQLANDPDFRRHLEITKDRKSKTDAVPMGMSLPHPPANSGLANKLPVKNKPQASFFKCGICPYQTRNKTLMFHHEKTAHLKKKTFKCTECNYVTSEKSRYTKHIKYHNLPKLQCNFCFFKTAYKWNMDRHMKNHEVDAEGSFHCSECNFTTSTKQSYNAHVTNHHDPSSIPVEEQDGDEVNGDEGDDDDSNEWEDINGGGGDDGEEGNGESFQNNEGTFDDYEFSEAAENPDNVWKQGKPTPKTLKCQQCDFKASWPFELKKHEENHRSQKKHLCPICGMRFEHVAWLIKHLRRIHAENPQAKSLAAAYDVMKPARRRPGKEYAIDNIDNVLPVYQDVLKQQNSSMQSACSSSNNRSPDSKSSMLSTLLKKPLNPFAPPSVSKYSATLKSKGIGASTGMFKQPRISNFYQKVSAQETPETKPKSSVPTCNICNYKTRWMSELQRHMRVHSQDKPFQCHKCKYVCKWKGDLNRHLIKYHGIKMQPFKKQDPLKFGMKRSNSDESMTDWQATNVEKRNPFASGVRSSQEGPLDLTYSRETFPHPNAMSPYDAYDFESQSAVDGDSDSIDVISVDGGSPLLYPDYNNSPVSQPEGAIDNSSGSGLKAGMKYQCPRCPFTTTTVSRFHVHIVQHNNKRPFMCSVCGYNSNWEWDITKHIRLKGCRDKDHNKACVLLTDECGRRNYEKYEKFLVDSNQAMPGYPQTESPDMSEAQENQSVKFNLPKLNYNESSSRSCSYDFRNIGSNFEDGPVNIVVTPDIPLPDNPDSQESQDNSYLNNQSENNENGLPIASSTPAPTPGEGKFFFCKHCDFRHATKRVLVSHLSSHSGLKPFRCRTCGIVSNWRHVIVRHVKDMHNGQLDLVEERINYVQEGFALRLISFPVPENDNDNDDSIPEPEKSSSDQFYGCKICPYKCDKEFYMNFHMKQHRPREGAVFKCDFCPYFVKFKKTLVRHMKLHNPPSSAIKINGNSSATTGEDQPQQLSNDIYDFYDNQENDQSIDDSIAISFNQLNQFDEGDTSPQKIKRHMCEHCPYKTDNKTQYLYHKQFHRPNPSAPFKCNVCSYWATMQHLLTQHLRVHSENGEAEPSDSPKEAPKQFFDFFDDKEGVPEKISIVYVKKGEETVKMFKCEFCPMMNKKKANVRVHQKMHGVIINDGRFACSYCNYQCLNQGGLTNHMKVHQKNLDHELFNRYFGSSSPEKFFGGFDEEVTPPPVRQRTNSYFCFKCPGIFKTARDLENHERFHGINLPLKCTYCDYRAKQKPHITQHLAVHTAEYKAKRKASTPMNVPADKLPLEENSDENKEVMPAPKKIDQMLLLEASELQIALKKTGEAAANLHKCIFCPASFSKTSILVYHVSLHGSEGEFKCTQCDYAASRGDNLRIHNLVHPKKAPVKRTLKSYACPKCPAVFYKQDRHERHLELHGKNYRFACDQCDYSVRFAANLIKHKKIHLVQRDGNPLKSSANNENVYQTSPGQAPITEYVPIIEPEEKKVTYICDRCPYIQARKDAVQSHQRRHWLKDGYECPHCDYSSMQNSFLQNHIKLHMTPNNLFPPQAFIKFESFKIYVRDENGEKLLFDDEDVVKETPEKESEMDAVPENVASKEEMIEPEENTEHNMEDKNSTASEDIKRLFDFSMEDSHTDSNLSRSSCRSDKVPIVVLSDIYANDSRDMKRWDSKLKIPKLKIRKKHARSSSSERSHKKLKVSDSPHHDESSKSKKSSKPSLVVKIKVENRINKHEKTMYSVSKRSDEHLAKDKENSLESPENTNDSTSDLMLRNSVTSLPVAISVSPVEDIEENTLTSNPDVGDRLREADTSIEDMVDSIVGSANEDLILPRRSEENVDLKSDDSFSNDTVPAVSEILCEKLDCLTELSFKDSDLGLMNGDCSNHLTSNLIPEEIKVSL